MSQVSKFLLQSSPDPIRDSGQAMVWKDDLHSNGKCSIVDLELRFGAPDHAGRVGWMSESGRGFVPMYGDLDRVAR